MLWQNLIMTLLKNLVFLLKMLFWILRPNWLGWHDWRYQKSHGFIWLFFPNKRKGWWQKGDAYIHRKLWIDSLFENESVKGFSHIVKLFARTIWRQRFRHYPNAYLKTQYKSMQETGLEAELYFLNHYKNIKIFSCGHLKTCVFLAMGMTSIFKPTSERF